ncbi:MAG: hypothetical protein ACYDHM_15970 [Acidiferrobacterales bacterium]
MNDWLVTMRRLPAERFPDRTARNGPVADAEARLAATHLASFYHQIRALCLWIAHTITTVWDTKVEDTLPGAQRKRVGTA